MATPRKKSHKSAAKKSTSRSVHTSSAKKNRAQSHKKKGLHKLLTAEGWKRLMFGKSSKKK